MFCLCLISTSGCEVGNIHANYECLHQLSAEDVVRASPLDVPPYWANAQIMDLPTPCEKKGALAIVDGNNVLKYTDREKDTCCFSLLTHFLKFTNAQIVIVTYTCLIIMRLGLTRRSKSISRYFSTNMIFLISNIELFVPFCVEFLIKKKPMAAWPSGYINDVPVLIGS